MKKWIAKWWLSILLVLVAAVSCFFIGRSGGQATVGVEKSVPVETTPESASVPATQTPTPESQPPVVNVYNNFTMKQNVGGTTSQPLSQKQGSLVLEKNKEDGFMIYQSGYYEFTISPNHKIYIDGREVLNSEVIKLERGPHTCEAYYSVDVSWIMVW